jgi:hypothetical protein
MKLKTPFFLLLTSIYFFSSCSTAIYQPTNMNALSVDKQGEIAIAGGISTCNYLGGVAYSPLKNISLRGGLSNAIFKEGKVDNKRNYKSKFYGIGTSIKLKQMTDAELKLFVNIDRAFIESRRMFYLLSNTVNGYNTKMEINHLSTGLRLHAMHNDIKFNFDFGGRLSLFNIKEAREIDFELRNEKELKIIQDFDGNYSPSIFMLTSIGYKNVNLFTGIERRFSMPVESGMFREVDVSIGLKIDLEIHK